MRNHEIISAFTKAIPNNRPTAEYFRLYHQGCTSCDSLMHMLSSERTSKSVSNEGVVFMVVQVVPQQLVGRMGYVSSTQCGCAGSAFAINQSNHQNHFKHSLSKGEYVRKYQVGHDKPTNHEKNGCNQGRNLYIGKPHDGMSTGTAPGISSPETYQESAEYQHRKAAQGEKTVPRKQLGGHRTAEISDAITL